MVSRTSPSPDPLALGGNEEEIDDCIIVTSTSPKFASARTPSKSSTLTPRRRNEPVVEIITPKKRKKIDNDGVDTPKKTPGSVRKGLKTPIDKKSRGISPTPNGKVKPTPMSIPSKRTQSTTVLTPTKKSTPIQRLKGTPTLASSSKRTLPTPTNTLNTPNDAESSRKRARISATPSSKGIAKTLTFDDGIFESPSTTNTAKKTKEEISRETFLANEALKRQREARNFNYEGDSSAPKLTRSGRLIGQDDQAVDRETHKHHHHHELDEYGGEKDEDINPLGIEAPLIPDVDVNILNTERYSEEEDIQMKDVSEKPKNLNKTIPPPGKLFLKGVLSSLNSQNISINPPPFIDEDKNEALNGLVNLLKGTVERGEGNSALVVGPRGVGKTRTIARALNLLPSISKTSPIIVRLSGLAQTNDRLAIREMGRQIAEAEGKKVDNEEEDEEEEGNEEEYAPTTLPSHLLALLTQPSPRTIIIIIEEFDLFTEHARQALLYCLLDVVQSIKTGPVDTTGRGVAVIGVTTRVDTLLLLEKRVKSRFSHRTFRIPSPLSSEGMGWKKLLQSIVLPSDREAEEDTWKGDWKFAMETLFEEERVKRNLDRLTGLTTDVRNLYRAFVFPIINIMSGQIDFLDTYELSESVLSQVEGAGWGLQLTKLKGLPHPALGILIITKHLSYAGREEFNFSQIEEEYLRFSRTKLVGSGKVRWPIGVLKVAFEHLIKLSLLIPASNTSVKPQFQKFRCTLLPNEIVNYFKGPGQNLLGPELGSWGRMMGGHA
ncbi:uncharacterized protein L201_006865 [Kwoniella dendrophila CBS 6074]|uniref:Origin recognition complex subunit 4 n=1 Tax=Kwoniella dendrophila CBS 6074 TaxID=1295534 RepID=A0AAX4K418_9TREE